MTPVGSFASTSFAQPPRSGRPPARAASDDHPGALPFVTLDDRLALAASREAFPVLGLD